MSEQRRECVIEGDIRPDGGLIPAAAIVIVGFLLAAIVGMTSSAAPWAAAGGGGSSSPPAPVGEVLAVALAAGLCILLGLAWIHTPRRGKPSRRGLPAVTTEEIGSSLRSASLVMVAVILAVVLLAATFWFLLEQGNEAQPPPRPGATSGATGVAPGPEPAPSASPAFDWFLLGLVGSLAVVVPLAVLARRRLAAPDGGSDADDGTAPDSVVRAVGESIDQIERDPDPRRAIIRAYAQMEHAFDDAGVPRRPYEAPLEYLGRALGGVRVSPPAAGRLAALFERARFSQHAVDPETKHEAIGVLREVERELQEPSP